MINLDSQVKDLNRVGKVLAARLKKKGIETVRDLFFYFPFRYDDFSLILPIVKLQAGAIVTIKGKIDLLSARRSFRRRKILTEGLISDDSGSIKVVWFNQPWIAKNLKVGDEVYISGRVTGDLLNIYFNSPTYEKASSFNVNTARLVPVYPLTEGITQKQIRFLLKSTHDLISGIEEFLPLDIIKKFKLIDISQAIGAIHLPENSEGLDLAKKRLGFDELFLIQLWTQLLKKKLKEQKAIKIKFFEDKIKEFVGGLGFVLTPDQKRSAWEILQDLQLDSPMNRLLEGDVGSGKTVVSALAFYSIFLNKCQSAFMAPTEILAGQHYRTLIKFLSKYGVRVGLLTRSQRLLGGETLNKNEFLKRCLDGEVDLVVGTHALIQKNIKFKNLALVVVDEQHRFGVDQRKSLKQKGRKLPHFLSLTATPIPRSLALTVYGDLSLSMIRQMPAGRKKIITRIVSPDKRTLAYQFIRKQINMGRQVFVVCPLIDPSDKLGVRAATAEYERLNKEIFSDLSIGLLHGRLRSEEKDKAINDFANKKIQILVSTSVIEVGIDMPNASVMMIEGAERFGLAQLHQFRGRVGRAEHQSYCFLFSENADAKVIKRLQSLVECHDGFELAQKDLEFRGAGAVYGYDQSGFLDANLKIANLSDLALVKEAREAAQEFLASNKLEDYPLLANKIKGLKFSEHLE